MHGGAARTAALLERLLGCPDVPGVVAAAASNGGSEPVLAMRVVKGATAFKLFTTEATPGAPGDVTAQEVRIERSLPADEATSEASRAWAALR